MLRQSSSRNYRSKKLRPRHSFQAFLLFAVGIWIVYQLTRSSGNRRAVVVEIDDGDAMDGGEVAWRRLGRKGFLGFAGDASDDDIVAGAGRDDDVGSQGARWSAASSHDSLSKTEEGGDGDEDDLAVAADEDEDGDDADDDLTGDEEGDDDRDNLLSQNGDGEDELKTAFGGSDRATVFGNGDGDDGTALHEPKKLVRAKATGSVQDTAASRQRNATDDSTAAVAGNRASVTDLSDSTLKNGSSVNQSLHDRGTASDDAKKLVVNGLAVRGAGAENQNQNETAY